MPKLILQLFAMKKSNTIRLLTLAILFFLLNTVRAQKETKHPQARLLSTVPFRTFSGGVIIIKIQLGDIPDSLSFLIDTGSSTVSFDSATSARYQMLPEISDQVLVGIGGVRNAMVVKKQNIHLGNFTVDNVNLNVVDYTILSSVYGEKINGILGNSFLARFIVGIDYDSSKLYFYSKGNFNNPKGGFYFNPLIAGIPMQTT